MFTYELVSFVKIKRYVYKKEMLLVDLSKLKLLNFIISKKLVKNLSLCSTISIVLDYF